MVLPPTLQPERFFMSDDVLQDPDVLFRIALSHVQGIGGARVGALLSAFGNLESAWTAPEPALAGVLGPSMASAVAAKRRRLDLDGVVRSLRFHGIGVLTPAMDGFPVGLRQVDGAPFLLYYRGDPAALRAPAAAIVGTRAATDYGLRQARRLAARLASGGLCVVSGLAVGIDAAAHEGALSAGGRTVAVLPCGLAQHYPPETRKLRDVIVRQGAVVSPFAPQTRAEKGNFHARNRIVSALARCTVVVEAGEKSGALITARSAASQGRDVFVFPGPVDAEKTRGCLQLHRDGALIVISLDWLLEQLDLGDPRDRPQLAWIPEDASEAALLAVLDGEPRHVDDLGRASRLEAREVTRALSVMEIKGMARHVGGMRWTATRWR